MLDGSSSPAVKAKQPVSVSYVLRNGWTSAGHASGRQPEDLQPERNGWTS